MKAYNFTYIKIRIEAKKIFCVLKLNQSQWLKLYVEFNTQERIEAQKFVKKMEKRCTN